MRRTFLAFLILLAPAVIWAPSHAAETVEAAPPTAPRDDSEPARRMLAALEGSLARADEAFAADDPRAVAALAELDAAYRQAGAHAEAEATYARIIAAEETFLPDRHHTLAPLLAFMITARHPITQLETRESVIMALDHDPDVRDRVLRHLSAVSRARGTAAEIAKSAAASPQHSVSPGGSGYHIQFAALKNPSNDAHRAYLKSIRTAHGDLLGGYALKVFRADADSGFHRMVAGPMTEGTGRALCPRMATRGQACMLVIP